MLASSFPWTAPSGPSLAAFLSIVGAVVVAGLAALAVSTPPAERTRAVGLGAGVLLAWLALHAGLAGFLEAGIPWSLPAYMGFTNGTALVLALSPVGRRLARGVPLAALVAFPLYRLPLEIVLHSWADQGVIPISMSWSGQNLDVIAGVLGPMAAMAMVLLPAHARRIAWVANTVCLGFLINVARVAILSSPGPQHSFEGPPLVLAMHVPEVWIVAICVAGALFGHIVTYRALSGASGTETSAA